MARRARVDDVVCTLVLSITVVPLFAGVLCAAEVPEGDAERGLARQILKTAGVEGGLVVHVGCGDGRLTAALHAGDRYLVHGLDTDADAVARARDHVRRCGLYGAVSVDTFDGTRLPYADDLVNLLVMEGPSRVAEREIRRVLAPRGVALVSGDRSQGAGGRGEQVEVGGRTWLKIVEPWPEGIDEWTHSLHSPGGNPVAEDRVVGPPRRLRWTAGPLWARSHGWTPSVSAMVSAGGRLFSICDETLSCVDGTVPGKWALIARDAFSGVLLWKHPIPEWGSAALSGTPDTGGGGVVGRFTMPPNVSKRLVAVGDTVFVTLGPAAPITALDAATGRVKRVYAGTARADEVLCTGERLIVSINPPAEQRPVPVPRDATPPPAPGKEVCAVNVATGEVLWKRGPFAAIRACTSQDPFGRLELAAGDGKVFVLTAGTIVCMDEASGKTLWQLDRPALPEEAVRRIGFAGMYEYLLSVMVYHDGVVLLAQPEPNTHHTYHTMPGTLYAFDAADGRAMWEHAYGGWGHCTPPDVFVAGDVVWTHVNAETEFGSVWGNGYRAKDSSKVDYRIQALDLRTGRTREELSTRDIFNVGHHHRCYRNRMAERFLLSCRRGVEFVNLSTGENYQDHWVRSGCLLGYLPCNGLLYVTPHPCECYINAKLVGFNALAAAEEGPEKGGQGHERAEDRAAGRLERGSAYPHSSNPQSLIPNPSDWPTYRHDPRRTGATESNPGTELATAWRAEVGAKPSAPVVAGGMVLVAGVDDHTVHALRTEDGRPIWTHTASARVDSPPTLLGGLAIFGSRDGRVTCLRASDGALVWRFDAAPERRLVTAFGRLESAWPVPGSVLIHDGKCWFAAGRSSHLDGGIHVYALDPATGKVLQQETIYSLDPETGRAAPITNAHAMPGLLGDIPATDGAGVFIRQMEVASTEGRRGPHLFTTGGYLDPSWFNRTFWHAGRAQTSGLMVLGNDAAYGMELYPSRSRETVFKPGANAYRLMCIALKPPAGGAGKPPAGKRRRPGGGTLWEQHLAIRVTAMVRAGETIFAAGSPDVVDPKDPHGAWEGRKGGVLAAFAAGDGEKLAEWKLPAPPVWDGMAVADCRLCVSTVDGYVVCMDKPSRHR